MKKNYDSHTIEQKWYQLWKDSGCFAPRGNEAPYCITIPPPNVTGTLHLGHGFQLSIMDALIRYHRMCGDRTLWQLGTDHAGIATQMVVENLIKKEGKTKHELGRTSFTQRIWQWKEQSGNIISKQQQRLGISGDWSRTRFTLDEDFSLAVRQTFIKLYEENLIYRGKRLVNWDPILKTAVSDLEVINQESDGFLWHINYPLAGTNQTITIATTRPETMFGDVALAVHPQDLRYQSLIGKTVILPLSNKEIPIIADSYVDQEFGTGCVKITPAHDFNDYEIGKRHQLPLINTLTDDACLNNQVPIKYQNLDRFVARKIIIDDLAAEGLLVKTEKHQINLPKGDRTEAILEPYLTDQWFVRTKELAQPAIRALNDGSFQFAPNYWNKTYLQWLENIEDWCISRQLWWGHQIPVWYDQDHNSYVGSSEEEVRAKFKLDKKPLKQDEDVLDTWFSAAIWPFSSLGWPKATEELKTFYPTSVLVTGFDIISFWVARMMMFGLKFTGQVPFKEVYITGLIRDSYGQKMSKSKGNILDPIDLIDGISLEQLIEKRTANLMQPKLADKIRERTHKEYPDGITAFGADALRLTFYSLATTNREINFDLARLEGYRNFCTKLWNAARLILAHLTEYNHQNQNYQYSDADYWIQNEFQITLIKVTTEIKNYRFDLALQASYEFVWHQLCDWYLELIKITLAADNISEKLKLGARRTAAIVLEKTLRLLHPFAPFITEEIWQELSIKLSLSGDFIMSQSFPQKEEIQLNQTATANLVWFKEIINALRNLRGEMNIPPTKHLPLLVEGGTEQDLSKFIKFELYLKQLAKLSSIQTKTDQEISTAASSVVDHLTLHLIIDQDILAAEKQRLAKEIEKLNKTTEVLKQKLSNNNYLKKAPAAIVTKDKKNLSETLKTLEKLKYQLNKIA